MSYDYSNKKMYSSLPVLCAMGGCRSAFLDFVDDMPKFGSVESARLQSIDIVLSETTADFLSISFCFRPFVL